MADHVDAAPEHTAPEHTAPEHSGDVNLITVNPGALPVNAAPVEKPAWATGDPFFDTMAGMDSSEYRQYLNQVSQKNITSAANDQIEGLVSTANSMALSEQIAVSDGPSNQSSLTATGAASSSATYINTGLEHWNRTREQWTKGRWHVVPSANSNNPALSAIHPGNHDAIYDSLVYDRKRLSKPIPLPLVVGDCIFLIASQQSAKKKKKKKRLIKLCDRRINKIVILFSISVGRSKSLSVDGSGMAFGRKVQQYLSRHHLLHQDQHSPPRQLKEDSVPMSQVFLPRTHSLFNGNYNLFFDSCSRKSHGVLCSLDVRSLELFRIGVYD